jgi:hypothetical protein
MKKLMGLVLLALMLGMVSRSEAAMSSARGAKYFKTINFSASASLLCKGPGVVYSILTSTGAVTDYVVLRDSATANTSSTVAVSFSPSATLTQNITLDPPLQFKNGISVNAPATNSWELVTFDCGVEVEGF